MFALIGTLRQQSQIWRNQRPFIIRHVGRIRLADSHHATKLGTRPRSVHNSLYEWRRRDGQAKQLFAIARADGSPLALAGLWEGYRWPTGEVTRTFTVLTTAANRLMQNVHDRMPVALEPEDWPLWLGEVEGDLSRLLHPAAEDVLRLWPISTAVNATRNNGPDLLKPIQEADAPMPSGAPPGPNPA